MLDMLNLAIKSQRSSRKSFSCGSNFIEKILNFPAVSINIFSKFYAKKSGI